MKIINGIFEDEHLNINLKNTDYDCGFIESIPKTEMIRPTIAEINEKNKISANGVFDVKNKISRDDSEEPAKDKQTNLIISVKDCFQFLNFEDMNNKFKILYPFFMHAENLKLLFNHLKTDYYSDDLVRNLLEIYVEENKKYEMTIGVGRTTQNRTMIASKEMVSKNEGGKFHLECRYAMFAGDYLIVLKHKGVLQYTMFLIPNTVDRLKKIDLSTVKNTLIGEVSKTYFEIEGFIQVTGAQNLLVFGAPGTGKSHWVKENYEEVTESIRVTFHEEYGYSDFVGSLKPISKAGIINYKFRPGPFTKILALALDNPSIEYTLIIEELNRANAAAVFGDLFQILDRDEQGYSKYSIENEDITAYLKKQIDLASDLIYLPANLNVIATMNSADQGVYALDTAFKRRWNFKYIPIEFDSWHEEIKIDYFNTPEGIREISVKDFIETINSYLSRVESLELNEDRLIGPYFIGEEQWGNWLEQDVFQKLLNYLWDDVARINRTEVFLERYKQFSKVCADFKNLENVFVEPLHTVLMKKAKIKVS